MKAVLISIQPKWCELIAAGKKTVEVRKNKPKLEPPFRCYIYCTVGGEILPYSYYCGYDMADFREDFVANGNVIGEFTCKEIDIHPRRLTTFQDTASGSYISKQEVQKTCLSMSELNDYFMGATAYFWQITDLTIYDKPKPLSVFYKECAGLDNTGMCWECEKAFGEECDCTVNGQLHLTRPPQSWCYVEELT